MTDTDPVRRFLRHTLATLAYRGAKAVRGAPPGFSGFQSRENARTPGQILAHIGDLLDWGATIAHGATAWKETPPADWDGDVARFFRGLQELDRILASEEPLGNTPEKLFQGPIADALSHVGQIAILRRMAGTPVRGESYFKADIAAGRLGAEQKPPRFEFD